MKRLAGIARILRTVAMVAAACGISACGDYDDMGPNPPWNLSADAAPPSVGK